MPLLLGLFVLGAVVLMLKWYGEADVKQLKVSLRWTGVLLGLLLIVGLAVTGRLGPALAGILALIAWMWRVFHAWNMLRQMGGVFRGRAFGKGAAGAQDSEVESSFLRMHLDHATGALDGEVVHGTFRGRRVGTLSREELRRLLAEVGGDVDSRNLLEAYLDRHWPEWREETGTQAHSASQASVMDEAEALRILGLSKGATTAEIKAAHRRLMGQLHPDRGGSDYLAAKVNAAKDLLLKGAP